MKFNIAITIGDPSGIGPEIIINSIRRLKSYHQFNPIIIGDKKHLQKTCLKLRKNPAMLEKVNIFDLNNYNKNKFTWGKISKEAGRASGTYIHRAIMEALQNRVQAIVTCPIHKKSFELGGWGKKYVGHLEMIKALTHAKEVATVMCHKHFRSIQVTSHVPIKKIPQNITKYRIYRTITLGHRFLKDIGIKKSRIAVSGLNPHAGDSNIMGTEEKNIISPAIHHAKRSHIHAEGPFSPDVIWPLVFNKKFDLGVAMYHDQAQIPIKLFGFQIPLKGHSQVGGVNVTVGSKIIRTSVDHGTAFDIAGKGIASNHSFLDAYEMAIKLIRGKK